jgi:hypothetical protein
MMLRATVPLYDVSHKTEIVATLFFDERSSGKLSFSQDTPNKIIRDALDRAFNSPVKISIGDSSASSGAVDIDRETIRISPLAGFAELEMTFYAAISVIGALPKNYIATYFPEEE